MLHSATQRSDNEQYVFSKCLEGTDADDTRPSAFLSGALTDQLLLFVTDAFQALSRAYTDVIPTKVSATK